MGKRKGMAEKLRNNNDAVNRISPKNKQKRVQRF